MPLTRSSTQNKGERNKTSSQNQNKKGKGERQKERHNRERRIMNYVKPIDVERLVKGSYLVHEPQSKESHRCHEQGHS